jgi:hypothetical protein
MIHLQWSAASSIDRALCKDGHASSQPDNPAPQSLPKQSPELPSGRESRCISAFGQSQVVSTLPSSRFSLSLLLGGIVDLSMASEFTRPVWRVQTRPLISRNSRLRKLTLNMYYMKKSNSTLRNVRYPVYSIARVVSLKNSDRKMNMTELSGIDGNSPGDLPPNLVGGSSHLLRTVSLLFDSHLHPASQQETVSHPGISTCSCCPVISLCSPAAVYLAIRERKCDSYHIMQLLRH